ncbi:MAG: MATE family efflux transporter [Ruminococcaceae bacterium]|nr:MATE family efflux transporter [Oscillospiraceae bacterium]
MSRVTNMTVGDPKKLILTFSFPIIITNIGQQLYNVVDTAIVGRGVGMNALAAVGCTTWIYGIILWSILALTYGFSTFVSRYFGMGDRELLNRSLAMSIVLSTLIGIFFTVVGIFATRPLLELLNTPPEIIDDAALYLYVMIGGTMPVMGYNLTSSVLRAFGDGKSPLIAMIIAALLNVGLDILFVIVIPWGVFGAAFASVVSQLISFLYCVARIKKIEYVNIKKEYFKWDGVIAKELIKFSMPLGIMNATLAVGGLVLQAAVNLEGSIFIAGYTATNRLYGMFECTAIALGHAITTYMSQNFGAGNIDRVKKGFKTSFLIAVVFSVIVMGVMLTLGKPLLKLFIDPTEAGAGESLDIAFKYLLIMLYSLIILYLLYVYRSTLQAIGTSFWSMLSGFAEFAARVFFAKVLYFSWGSESIYYVESAAWLAALITVIPPCYYHLKRLKKNNETTT